MTTDEILRLMSLASMATPGPWRCEPDIRPDVMTDYGVNCPDGQGGYFMEGQVVRSTRRYAHGNGGHIAELAKNYGNDKLPGSAMDDAEFIAACDPTTIAALCRANLRLVAMEEAVRKNAVIRYHGCVPFIEQRTAEILASLTKGENTSTSVEKGNG